jgi:hypothetical protein
LQFIELGQKNAGTDFETNTVFGLMWFGSQTLRENPELFYYRTGIALKLWEKGVGRHVI